MRKQRDDDMARDWTAIEDAMSKDRERNPPLGSPAWARQQEAKRAAGSNPSAPAGGESQ